jgi:Sigma-70, region 4
MARNEKEVDRNVDDALGVMGLTVYEEPEEPVEDVWTSTHGACLVHRRFMHPCPVEWCRFHVYSGGMRDDAVGKIVPDSDTCVLRMACGSPHTLEEVGQAFGVTRERIRQIELAALSRVGAGLVRIGAISQAEVGAEKLAKIWKMSRRGRPLK